MVPLGPHAGWVSEIGDATVRRGIQRGDKTTARVRGTLPEVELVARRLRRMLTPAEQVLWDAIRRGAWAACAFGVSIP
jgi:hypothetical protein